MNLVLLCHGRPLEDSNFDVGDGQTLQYRGNYGSPLSGSAARTIVQALLQDPTVGDEQLRTAIPNYDPLEALVGPRTSGPDIALAGDDALPCFFLNLTTRALLWLPSGWHARLGGLLRDLGSPLWLNLLCCTEVPGAGVVEPTVDRLVQVNSWAQVLQP